MIGTGGNDMERDIISYRVYELDIFGLKKKLRAIDIKEVVVYGVGNNSRYTCDLLQNLGIKIRYFVDVKAYGSMRKYKGHAVISPDEFQSRYTNEYIIITPSIHDSISSWARRIGIPEDRIIETFYETETIDIDYGGSYGRRPSDDITYCNNEIQNVRATFVTIAYNTPENLLRRAIESVLRQNVREWKYLFLVNGATDCTAEIIKEYAENDSRICIVDLGSNLPWTDPRLLSAIRDNLEGDYCCQLDSDDYYAENFLEETLAIGDRNRADVVSVRTCLFSSDRTFDPMSNGLEYDGHDKFYFNLSHPPCHMIGHHSIMTCYANSEICSTFWGKLYANDLMKRYLDHLIMLPDRERELYYRLDIAMTYQILYMAQRVFFSDKVLHFSQYSKKNSTFTLAPIEWLMSLWYAYQGIKKEMCDDYKRREAHQYAKRFINVHILWMVGRKGMLLGSENWKYREDIIAHFREMIEDPIFEEVLFQKNNYMVKECGEFYETVKALAEQGGAG